VQHNAIVERMNSLVAESSDDVRVLARLWQLKNKMESVGPGGSYGEHTSCLFAPYFLQCSAVQCSAAKHSAAQRSASFTGSEVYLRDLPPPPMSRRVLWFAAVLMMSPVHLPSHLSSWYSAVHL
jgi:hypothetical protein